MDAPERAAVGDAEIEEEWTRKTSEPDVRGVTAYRRRDCTEWPWTVMVYAMEFVREDPLETRLRDAIRSALAAVPGVVGVEEEDREVWIVDGAPDARALIQSACDVVDHLQDEVRQHIRSL